MSVSLGVTRVIPSKHPAGGRWDCLDTHAHRHIFVKHVRLLYLDDKTRCQTMCVNIGKCSPVIPQKYDFWALDHYTIERPSI